MIVQAVRELGYTAHAMADLYPGGADEDVSDVTWIADADRRSLVVLTKDERIVRHADEQEALRRSTLRVFAIANQNLTGAEMARYLRANMDRIVQRSRRPGPFVDVIYRNSVERRWPTDR